MRYDTCAGQSVKTLIHPLQEHAENQASENNRGTCALSDLNRTGTAS